ncbi:uncharacterized protein LOC118797359 [Colossoma macropomum]|uniref:uncharacterized protein LOC118797359 n=1 Tax=Colossoma macropomum TaxID=42526 RepID=UPI00186544F6|nr:uncharacterized protein LOC118797359 [Colossoma macropomum]
MTLLLLRCLTLLFLWSLCAARPTENPTYMRECVYEGHWVVLLSDRLQVDGKDVLVLDKVNHKWTVFSADGHQDPELTNLDTLQILEGCEELKKELSHMENSAGVSWSRVVSIVLATLFFISLVVLSFKMSKRYGAAGGVLGSIIHYPAHFPKDQSEKRFSHLPTYLLTTKDTVSR